MWGLFSNNSNDIDLYEGNMSEAYRKRCLSINGAFFLLIIASFTFINLIFVKNICDINDEINHSQLINHSSIKNLDFSLNSSNLFSVSDDFSKKVIYLEKSQSCKIILFGLNLLFFFIVIYTIGSFTFTISSMKSIEDQFIDQLERNKELKRLFKEKSRYIRHRFKRKLIELKSKKNVLVNTIKGFLDDQASGPQSPNSLDELKNLRLNLHMNNIGAWSWDVKKDIVTIDNACYKLLHLKKSAFVGGYSLFLNFFDGNSRRKLKKDIASALKYLTAFETACSMKIANKGLILKGNIVYDSDDKARKIQGVLIQTECPARAIELQKQFLNQPIALFAILDKDFCFEFLNPAWLDNTGYSMSELKNYPMFNFIHQREKRLFLNNLHVLKQDHDSSVKNLQYRFRLHDGNFLKMNLVVSYENYRYYIMATPVHQKIFQSKVEYDFNFQENWDRQFLKS